MSNSPDSPLLGATPADGSHPEPGRQRHSFLRSRLTGSSALVPWAIMPAAGPGLMHPRPGPEQGPRVTCTHPRDFTKESLHDLSAVQFADLVLSTAPPRPFFVVRGEHPMHRETAARSMPASSAVTAADGENPMHRETAAQPAPASPGLASARRENPIHRETAARSMPAPSAVTVADGENPMHRENAAQPAPASPGLAAARRENPMHRETAAQPASASAALAAERRENPMNGENAAQPTPTSAAPAAKRRENPMHRENAAQPASASAAPAAARRENPMRRENAAPPAPASAAPAAAPRENPMHRENAIHPPPASVAAPESGAHRQTSARPTPPPTPDTAPRPNNPMQRERTGPLRNGNPRGNPNAAPRCAARTRLGCACRSPAMANGRCRMHGGASTGPRTPEGRARISAARTIHGRYTAPHIAWRRALRAECRTTIGRNQAFLKLVRSGAAARMSHAELLSFMPPPLSSPDHAPGGSTGDNRGDPGRVAPRVILQRPDFPAGRGPTADAVKRAYAHPAAAPDGKFSTRADLA